MKKHSKKMKVGLALAGFGAAFAGNVFAAQIDTQAQQTKPLLQQEKAANKVAMKETKRTKNELMTPAGDPPANSSKHRTHHRGRHHGMRHEGSGAPEGLNYTGAAVTTTGGLCVVDTKCPHFWFNVGGRLEFDEIVFSGDWRDRQGNFPTSGNIRRAFVAFTGGLGECLTYNLTLNFGRSATQFSTFGNDALTAFGTNVTNVAIASGPVNTTPGIVLIEDAWLGYAGLWDCSLLRFGQFTPLATQDGLPNYGLTNGQMFLESALATRAFDVPSYINTDSPAMKGLGIILNTELADMFTVGATVYQPATGPLNNYGDPRRSDRLGWAAKVTFVPVHECDTVYHLGLLARYQSLNHTDNSASLNPGSQAIVNTLFFTPPEVVARNYIGNPAHASVITVANGSSVAGTQVYDASLVNVGAIRAKSYNHIAGEAAVIWGPITVQGEYHHANVQRRPFNYNTTQQGNVSFYGWHAQAGYVLTGESRGYDFRTGSICGIKPCNPCGAWEVAARYSYIDLIDKDVYGGAERNLTLGLNWYINCNVRAAFNYIRADIDPTGVIAGTQPSPNVGKRKLDIFALRLQAVF